jgi:hypothetical protein
MIKISPDATKEQVLEYLHQLELENAKLSTELVLYKPPTQRFFPGEIAVRVDNGNAFSVRQAKYNFNHSRWNYSNARPVNPGQRLSLSQTQALNEGGSSWVSGEEIRKQTEVEKGHTRETVSTDGTTQVANE